MLTLLNPRLWIGVALVAALAFSHFTAYRKGSANVKQEWLAAVSAANSEARALERARQSRADDAARLSTSRQTRIAADGARVRSELAGMRDAADAAERRARESQAAADQYRATCTALLKESGGILEEIAGAADRHSSDVKLLLDAWPR